MTVSQFNRIYKSQLKQNGRVIFEDLGTALFPYINSNDTRAQKEAIKKAVLSEKESKYRKLVSKAENLKRKGFNNYNISVRLGVSIEKVRELLSCKVLENECKK